MMPQCFYQKAFWIVIPLLVALVGSTFAVAEAQRTALDERVTANAVEIAKNNVPEVKDELMLLNEKITNLQVSTARIEQKVNLLLP